VLSEQSVVWRLRLKEAPAYRLKEWREGVRKEEVGLTRDARTGESRRVAKEVVDEEVFGVVATDDRGETVHGNHLTTRITKTFTPSPRPQGFGAVTDDCEEAVSMDDTYPTTRIT
jgi:hypothetical protein